MFAGIVNFLGVGATGNHIINDRSSLDANWLGAQPFYISIDNADGLSGSDISTESHEIPGQIGEKSGDFFRRGKGITLSGTIWAPHLGGLEKGARYLEEVFWDVRERRLEYFEMDEPTKPVYLNCRVVNDVSIARQKPQDRDYRWSWTVGLRADDPRLYYVSSSLLVRSWQV